MNGRYLLTHSSNRYTVFLAGVLRRSVERRIFKKLSNAAGVGANKPHAHCRTNAKQWGEIAALSAKANRCGSPHCDAARVGAAHRVFSATGRDVSIDDRQIG